MGYGHKLANTTLMAFEIFLGVKSIKAACNLGKLLGHLACTAA